MRAGVLDDRQPRPRRVDVEADVAVAVGVRAGAVVAGLEAGDQAGLDDLGRQRVGEAVVAHRLRLAQHRPDPPPVLAAEVAAHALAQVGRLADVQHLVAVAAEQVDAGGARQARRHLAAWRPAGARPSRRASTRSSRPSTPSPDARSMSRCSRSVVASASSSARWVGRWSSRRRDAERAEPAVGHLVAHESSGEGDGVDAHRVVAGVAGTLERGAQERQVEADVVADEHGVARGTRAATAAPPRSAAPARRARR